ncbi:MAG: phosphatidylserine decarboxylase [Synergistaceae bacterium]|nr:phosphatidylserine decarboxylase [Synergistaceae bacterium]
MIFNKKQGIEDSLIFDRRQGGLVTEKAYGSRVTAFLYGTLIGGLFLLVIKRRWVSKCYALFQKIRPSRAKILKFANEYGLIVDDLYSYDSFNDFIARKEKRQINNEENVLIAPADSRLTSLKIKSGELIEIKGKKYTVARLIMDKELSEEFEGGYALIFRLAVYDYHRYCFPDSGEIVLRKTISGVLDSVNYGVTGKFSLCGNYRKVSLLETKNFDKVVFIEVGAMLVGRMVETHKSRIFRKGDEKGYFEFGGSTLVMLLKKDIVAIDEDILEYSRHGVEIKVKYGEKIGETSGGKTDGKIGETSGGKTDGKTGETTGGKTGGKIGETTGGKIDGKAGETSGGKTGGKIGETTGGKTGEKIGEKND